MLNPAAGAGNPRRDENMTYELKVNPKLVALAAVGAEVVGVDMTEELKKPIVVDRPAQGAPAAKGKEH